jgi:cytochrome c553
MIRTTTVLLLLAGFLHGQEAADPQGLEFFEKRIRPVLTERCASCHSAEAAKLKGSLYLDSREGMLKGGDTGPALVPGNPAKSLMMKALRWTDDDLKMPPKKKLSDEQISDLQAWVQKGAPWPASTKTAAGKPRKQIGLTVEEGRKFWAYTKPEKVAPPVVKDGAWPAGDIDRFILARLEAQGFQPAPPASKEVLLRRLYYDLVGVPPSPEQVDEFVKDRAPDAYDKVVDRLLASRSYGERWGRHWLDVVRYAESLTLRGFILKEAWRYRDYVIESFNADVPYDRFIREQVAGDLLPAAGPEDRRRQLVASTFLTLGNTNLEEQDKKQLEMDVVDEQLDTIGRAFLAQTIGCARCHDHKFDPIPTKDYYALAGILKSTRTLEHANVSKWLEVPLPQDAAREAELQKQDQAVAALQARIKAEREKSGAVTKLQPGKPATVIAVSDLPGVAVDDPKAEKVGEWKHSVYSGTYIGDGYVHDDNARKGEKSLTYHPELTAGLYEVRFAYSPGASRATNVPVTILSAEGEKVVLVNEQEHPAIDGRFVSLGRFRFENNQGYVMISNEGTKGHVTADAVVFLAADMLDKPAPDAAPGVTANLKELEAELKKLQDSGPKREMVMTVREEKTVGDIKIHVRGSVHSQGEKAPRGFLQVASVGTAVIPAHESGRREMADWLASRDNPLTARVIVNRVWHWLLGAGLVRTTDNFGTTGETPSHPELLDYLALRFDGSVKNLVREIVRSSAYRMAAVDPVRAPEKDPENRLLRGANRRRLDAESIRDSLLAVAGALPQDAASGPTYPASVNADYGYKHAGAQRSVYLPVFRNALPELFEVFNFADTSVSTGRRDTSTVAPQALFMLNNPFVLDQARKAAQKLLAEGLPDDAARVVRVYRCALGRLPSDAESAVALRFVKGGGNWASIVHALFASVEFRYVN